MTLIEILVVIAIIGLLSTLASINANKVRASARLVKAEAHISHLRTGLAFLVDDTGKWPNGCPANGSSNPEVNMNDAQAGFTQVPAVGDQGDGCFWVQTDLDNWDGPYAQETIDSWGNPYWFDPDYTPYQDCGSVATQGVKAVIYSFGPNGAGVNDYDCDDIWIALE